jgi:hypothetical protein
MLTCSNCGTTLNGETATCAQCGSGSQAVQVRAVRAAVGVLGVARIATRHYLSSEHLWSALHHAQIARHIQDVGAPADRLLEHRSAAMSCILAATGFLEALVNEIFSDAADQRNVSPRVAPLSEACRTLMAETWTTQKADRLSILEKFQKALVCAGQQKLAGERPYQDVSDLILLRNACVHFKPTWHDSDDEDRFKTRLRLRFSPSPYYAGTGNPWFPHKALGAGAAEWACEYVVRFADEWTTRLGIPQIYRSDLKGFGVTV